MIKNKYAAFALFIVLVIAFWNLFDFLYGTFITGKGYSFESCLDGGMPLVVGIVVGYLTILRGKDGSK
jgi:hypothetical protein